MERKIRIPTQKRALDKFNRIVDAAYKLFNERGYYNITTADISKEANVATGSVYAYFKDKREIYIRVIERLNESFNYPTREYWVENMDKPLNNPETGKELFRVFIKMMIEYHNFSKTFHDEMDALALLDDDIGKTINEQREGRTNKTREVFKLLSIPFKSDEEEIIFVHYTFLLIEDVCHKILYDEDIKDIDLCIDKCVNMLFTLFMDSTNYK
ncbi:AcrR family transcriptional regulator [Clostridium zeae]|uniref:AcrR family transcriptional regulator n=1 Tax=Clostridium zeae TaxID=2759022 RepID=A0ABQ1E4X4_9CLOT|nr:TetR/AcrR family transcriptional regulator [Clostridium zeae]GFZ29791.1 AcrR family transcriptional regulator [Clostridium zeae]